MIRFEAVSKRFRTNNEKSVDGLDLDVAEGEICVLVGPSGCGKTTSLRMINRLEVPSEGRVLVEGLDVATAEVTGLHRRIGYVMQHARLFPQRLTTADLQKLNRRVDIEHEDPALVARSWLDAQLATTPSRAAD